MNKDDIISVLQGLRFNREHDDYGRSVTITLEYMGDGLIYPIRIDSFTINKSDLEPYEE